MAKRRTAAQIQASLKAVARDVAKGLTVGDSCRRHGITEQSYYRWRRRKADGSDQTVVRLREVTVEVERFKQVLQIDYPVDLVHPVKRLGCLNRLAAAHNQCLVCARSCIP